MNFNKQQEEALGKIEDWWKRKHKPYFYLAGYAGTGKTTLAKYIGETFLKSTDQLYYGAFTGKAANRLSQLGCRNPKTIHSLIYSPVSNIKEEIFKLKEELADLDDIEEPLEKHNKRILEITTSIKRMDKPSFLLNESSLISFADLVIIDESSMISEALAQDLLSFEKPLLILGDPAQLPPVGAKPFFSPKQPDYFLTEIHRQALENPIIALSKKIREGGEVPRGDFGSVKKIKASSMQPPDLLDFDQIITGQNITRRNLNTAVRRELGRKGLFPVIGDKLVCLKNNKEMKLFNGSFCEVLRDAVPAVDVRKGGTLPDKHDMWFISEDIPDVCTKVRFHNSHFKEYREQGWANRFTAMDKIGTMEFDFGYALTVHKSQGSEWDNLLIVDDQFMKFKKKDRQKWLYTAVTRAKEKLTIAETPAPVKVSNKVHLERYTNKMGV